MKLCARAQKIKASYIQDQQSFAARRDRMIDAGEIGRADAMRGQEDGSKRAMARALNAHMTRCRECG
jgi:hypothetical protein